MRTTSAKEREPCAKGIAVALGTETALGGTSSGSRPWILAASSDDSPAQLQHSTHIGEAGPGLLVNRGETRLLEVLVVDDLLPPEYPAIDEPSQELGGVALRVYKRMMSSFANGEVFCQGAWARALAASEVWRLVWRTSTVGPTQVCSHGHMFMNTGPCEQLVDGRGNSPAQVCAHGHMFMNTGPCVYRFSRIDLNLTP
jgi:hypothetical protein